MPTVATVLQQARWEDPSFTELRHTDAVLRAALADYQDELVGKVADLSPEELALIATVPLPLATFSDGYALTEEIESEEVPLRIKKVLDWASSIGADGYEVPTRHIGMGARHGPHSTPAFWMRGATVFLIGAAADWRGYTELRIPYVPLPPETLSSTDELLFGSQATAVWKAYLAHRMAQRSAPAELARARREFVEEWMGIERQFLEDLKGRNVHSDVVRDTW